MGACQSGTAASAKATNNQPPPAMAKSLNANADTSRPKYRTSSINESSVTSNKTGMSTVVSFSEECPFLEGSVESKTDRITSYLKTSGATGSRVMVHIENPSGVPIEAVYDGVHNGRALGEGITGVVRLITHRKTGIQLAVKRLDLDMVDGNLDRLLDEIKIMCALDHPNIVCLEEVYEGDSELYLTQELCRGGDLFDRLEEQPDYHYSEAQCAKLVKQISSAVSYLHSKGVIHRDLKLENFLFQDENADSELKMIDFGLSKHFQEGDLQTEKVGTPYSVAPEIILGKG